MNRRRRAILDSLAPAIAFAMEHQPPSRPLADVSGLAVRARVTSEAPGEIMIYGRIGGGGWLMDGITASDVAAALRELGPGPVSVRINSGGGDVFEGVAIHSLLARHPGAVTVTVDALAASAASFIMLAGDVVRIARNAMVMIHDGMTGVFGNADTLRRATDLLDKVSDNIADMYAEKAGEDVEHWRTLMTTNGEDGTWYSSQDAYDVGLVDEIVGQTDNEDDDDVDARLSGWIDVLPREVAARVSASLAAPGTEPVPDPPDEEPTSSVALDSRALINMMREVFA